MKPSLLRIAGALLTLGVALGIAMGTATEGVTVWGLPAMVACAIVAIGMNWLAFVPAAMQKTESYYDMVGSVTYLSVVGLALLAAYKNGLWRTESAVTAAMVGVWTLRLGVFLFKRIHRVGKDGRFDAIKVVPSKFFFAWTMQGLWVFVTLLAVLVTMLGAMPNATEVMDKHPVTWVGWSLWVLGFGIEVIADRQKSVFNSDPANQGRWIDVGLWRTSQHPNYFGEWLLWTGLFVAGIPGYAGLGWLACLSPLFVLLLLTKGSGIPILDERAMAKWGDNPAYLAYRSRTSKFICLPPKA